MHAASLKRLSPCRLVCAALGQTARTCSHGSRTRTSPASKLGDECTEGSALMPATSGPHRVALERGLRSGFFRLCEFKFRECMLRPCPATCHVASVFAAQDPNVSSVFPCKISHGICHRPIPRSRYPPKSSITCRRCFSQPVLEPRCNAKYKPWLQAPAPAWNLLWASNWQPLVAGMSPAISHLLRGEQDAATQPSF